MIFKHRFFCIFVLLALLNVISGCSGDADKFRQAVIAGGLDIQEFVVTPVDKIINSGKTVPYTAKAKLEGESIPLYLTSRATWSSSDSAIASIDSSGSLTAIQDGVVTITARFADHVDSVQLIVSTANLLTIEIEGLTQVDKCRSFQYKANGQFDDNSLRPNIDVAWSVNGDQSIATISDEADSKGQLKTTQSGSFNVIATQGDIASLQEVTSIDSLTAVAVGPPDASIAKNKTQQFVATATYSDTATEDISSIANWTSDNAGIASVESKTGVVKGVATGSATISAACGGVQGSAAVTVTGQASVDTLRINDGKDFSLKEDEQDKDKLKLTLTLITDNDSKKVTEDASWSVDSNVLSSITVSDTKGSKGEMKITPDILGTTRVVATYEGLTERIEVKVESK